MLSKDAIKTSDSELQKLKTTLNRLKEPSPTNDDTSNQDIEEIITLIESASNLGKELESIESVDESFLVLEKGGSQKGFEAINRFNKRMAEKQKELSKVPSNPSKTNTITLSFWEKSKETIENERKTLAQTKQSIIDALEEQKKADDFRSAQSQLTRSDVLDTLLTTIDKLTKENKAAATKIDKNLKQMNVFKNLTNLKVAARKMKELKKYADGPNYTIEDVKSALNNDIFDKDVNSALALSFKDMNNALQTKLWRLFRFNDKQQQQSLDILPAMTKTKIKLTLSLYCIYVGELYNALYQQALTDTPLPSDALAFINDFNSKNTTLKKIEKNRDDLENEYNKIKQKDEEDNKVDPKTNLTNAQTREVHASFEKYTKAQNNLNNMKNPDDLDDDQKKYFTSLIAESKKETKNTKNNQTEIEPEPIDTTMKPLTVRTASIGTQTDIEPEQIDTTMKPLTVRTASIETQTDIEPKQNEQIVTKPKQTQTATQTENNQNEQTQTATQTENNQNEQTQTAIQTKTDQKTEQSVSKPETKDIATQIENNQIEPEQTEIEPEQIDTTMKPLTVRTASIETQSDLPPVPQYIYVSAQKPPQSESGTQSDPEIIPNPVALDPNKIDVLLKKDTVLSDFNLAQLNKWTALINKSLRMVKKIILQERSIKKQALRNKPNKKNAAITIAQILNPALQTPLIQGMPLGKLLTSKKELEGLLQRVKKSALQLRKETRASKMAALRKNRARKKPEQNQAQKPPMNTITKIQNSQKKNPPLPAQISKSSAIT